MFRLICLAIGYCFGMIQSSFIIGKLVYKIDIREHGSKSSGTTNTNRVLGVKAGLVVFACDILKAVAAYAVCALIFGGAGPFSFGGGDFLPGLYAGLGAILGHNFPAYMKFKGGKGVAATIGVLLCFDLRIALICYAVMAAVIIATRYVSLGSLVLTALFAVLTRVFGYDIEAVILAAAVAVLAWFQHRRNIARLVSGKESKLTFKRQARP